MNVAVTRGRRYIYISLPGPTLTLALALTLTLTLTLTLSLTLTLTLTPTSTLRRHVCLVGDSETAAAHPFLRRLLDYFSEHGEVRSAAEYGEAPATHRPHAPPPAAAAQREAAERARAP